MSQNIVVFFGGVSGENEISVITGTLVCNVLKRKGICVLPVYIDQSGKFICGERLADLKNFAGGVAPAGEDILFARGGAYILSKRGKIKKFVPVYCAFNCCHGGWGEGGGISGLCAAAAIPLASPGIAESAVFMDKHLTKIVLRGLGVPVLDYVYLTDISEAAVVKNFPAVVKPANLGSSIGVAAVTDRQSLLSALQTAFSLDSAAVVEPYISPRRELNCAVCSVAGNITASPCEEVFGGTVYSYDQKYSGKAKRTFPADIPEQLSRRIRSLSVEVCACLGIRGIVRFDYILGGDDGLYLSEVNTVPGSLAHYLIAKDFNAFADILTTLIDDAVARSRAAASKILVNTGIINNFASNACKTGEYIVK